MWRRCSHSAVVEECSGQERLPPRRLLRLFRPKAGRQGPRSASVIGPATYWLASLLLPIAMWPFSSSRIPQAECCRTTSKKDRPYPCSSPRRAPCCRQLSVPRRRSCQRDRAGPRLRQRAQQARVALPVLVEVLRTCFTRHRTDRAASCRSYRNSSAPQGPSARPPHRTKENWSWANIVPWRVLVIGQKQAIHGRPGNPLPVALHADVVEHLKRHQLNAVPIGP